jgi:pyruvate,orthophosphate dikinase
MMSPDSRRLQAFSPLSAGGTAHAAVVTRQLGKVCLVGCRDLTINENGNFGEIAGKKIEEGHWISLDGETGEVMLGRLDIVAELPQAELAAIDGWRRSGDPAARRD